MVQHHTKKLNPLYIDKQALHHIGSQVESGENRVCAGPYLQYGGGGGGKDNTAKFFSYCKDLANWKQVFIKHELVAIDAKHTKH